MPVTPDGELTIDGRISTASNGTYLARIAETVVVYKPVSGERPLWDFPDGTLANREVAAFHVSQAFGWNVVPHTWLRDGPLGPGSVQLWCEPDETQDAVALVPAQLATSGGALRILDGTDEHDREVSLVHEDSTALRRMAIFDVIVNNADRKGAHVLAMTGGHRYGVDHGLTFHYEHKLRTVLWGWAGDELHADEIEAVHHVRELLDGSLGYELAGLIDAYELDELAARCDRLVASARFPHPQGGMPAVPWPLF